MARLRFSLGTSRWVADENWHPDQRAEVLAGAALVSAGIAFLALGGIAAPGELGVRGVVLGGMVAGAWLLGATGTSFRLFSENRS